MKKLCVYCSRTGHTEEIAKALSEKTSAELVKITDGKDRSGVFGYIGAAVKEIFGKLPPLAEYKTNERIEDYDDITVAFPIWCEDVCIIAKSFLEQNKNRFNGKIHYVATHMSKLPYDKKIKALEKYSGKAESDFLSVSTKKYDWQKDLNEYIEKCM